MKFSDMIVSIIMDEGDEEEDGEDLDLLLLWRARDLWTTVSFNLNSFSFEKARLQFRFSREEIERLLVLFALPPHMTTKENTTFNAVDGLCILLRRLAYPVRYHDMTEMFGRHESAICHIFYCVLEHVHAKFYDILYFNKNFVRRQLDTYSRAIARKGNINANIWAFIDGTVRAICRPTRGQRSMYSGHKRKHGVKFQILVTPDGMIVHIWGGLEARKHDRTLLTESKIEAHLQSVGCFGNYFIYGDPAYGCTSHFICPYDTVLLTEEKKNFNKTMSKLRICVEWAFGDVVRYWSALDMRSQMKIQRTPCALHYTVAVLLTNCITMLRGRNVTSTYFGLQPPLLEEYFEGNHL
jgi:hypothetical protein